MKKIISVFLIILIFTGLSGCGKSRTDLIRDAIQGNWISSPTILGDELKCSFKNDNYSAVLLNGRRSSGKYEIEDGKIKLYDGDSGKFRLITYTYDEDSKSITMRWDDGIQLYPDW